LEAASVTATPPRRRSDAVRDFISRYGLIAILLVLPVLYGIQDLGDDGNLTRLGNNLVEGFSNGAILALIALGYTLVYGIIELINFAHGEVFMLGSLTAAALYSTFGLTPNTGAGGLILGLLAILAISMLVSGSLNVMIERVAYRPLRSAPKLAPLITAVGFSFILQNVGVLWRGGSPEGIPDLVRSQHELISPFGLTPDTGTGGLILGLAAILILAMLTSASLNVMIERVAYRPLRGAPKLAPLITAVGMSFVLQNVGILWIGASQVAIPDLLGSQKHLIEIWGVTVTRGHLLAIAVTIPLVILLTSFVARSRLGKAMRATAQDPEAARLMGINVDTTISLTFLLGGLMAGAAGLISALYQTSIWYFQGFSAGLYAFTAAVMGGIGNIRGAVLGGFIIGTIQGISDNRIGNDWTPAIVFVYLVIIMVFRPQGLIGEETREAG